MENNTGTLSIVSTPIGNLKDITLRALDLLKNAEYIACEDTRRTGMLLKFIRTMEEQEDQADQTHPRPMLISYFEHNELRRIPEIVTLLKNGKDVVLVSDAGTPTVSDPGYKLVRECIADGITVEAIPGASAVLSGLVSSGLPTDKFLFVGYPPHKPGNRQKLFEKIKQTTEILKQTIILYEAPHKLVRTLEELQNTFGDITIAIGRELTKLHEEIRREQISDSLRHFKKVTPKGEFVLIIHPEHED